MLKDISVECMEYLNEDALKKNKNMMLSVHPWVGMLKSLVFVKFLNIKYEFYGFSDDLVKTIN